MQHKDLPTLFSEKELLLPYLESEDTKSFLLHFSNKMDRYQSLLAPIDQDAFGSLDKDIFSQKLDLVIKRIKKVLHTYLNGFPAVSYSIFKQLIEEADLTTELIHFRTLVLDSGHRLYRTKKEHNPDRNEFAQIQNGFVDLLSGIDLFHVPFQKRRSIGTNRFSIPGFPCVYLSDSLYTSWSECINTGLEPFHAICFTNHRPLYVADLSPLNVVLNGDMSIENASQLYGIGDGNKIFNDYALLYPLVLACHSKIQPRIPR